MDEHLLSMIISRLDKMETKLDQLLTFKYKVIGGTILASLLLTTIFQIMLAYIQRN